MGLWDFISPLLLTIVMIILGNIFRFEPIIVSLLCCVLYRLERK